MPRNELFLLALLACTRCFAQTNCPAVTLRAEQTINTNPTPSSHLDVFRQSDGSYTAFELANVDPSVVLSSTPHFEKQIDRCLPPGLLPPKSSKQFVATPVNSSSFVAFALAAPGKYVQAGNSSGLIQITVFDSQHNLISTQTLTPPGAANFLAVGDALQYFLLADVTGDGKNDLIAAAQTLSSPNQTGIWVFPGNGDGSFGAGARQALPSAPLHVPFSVADLNGDGIGDIVFPNAANSGDTANQYILVCYGTGKNQFNPQLIAIPVKFATYGGFAIADLNGDGRADFVLYGFQVGFAPALVAVLANANGGFMAPQVQAPAVPYVFGPQLSDPVVGDLNGDNIPDVAFSTGAIFFGDGKGGFPRHVRYNVTPAFALMIADLNGDGISDLVFSSGTPDVLYAYPQRLAVLLGAGGGKFLGPMLNDIADTPGFNFSTNSGFALADFDGDGFPEIALLYTQADAVNWTILKPTPDRGMVALGQGTVNHPAAFTAWSVVVADFDGDGKKDLAVLLRMTSGGSELQIFRGRGNGTFALPVTTSLAENVDSLASADFNHDGFADLAGTAGGTVWARLGKGDGTFGPVTFSQAVTGPTIALGDFNHDGKVDLAVAFETAPNLTLYPGKGDGSFGAAVNSATGGYGGRILTLADVDGDGWPEVLVVNGIQLVVMIGRSDGTFEARDLNFPGAYTLNDAVLADMNRDGILDMVADITYRDERQPLEIYPGKKDGTFGAPIDGPLHSSFTIADMNGDGLPDLIELAPLGVSVILNVTHAGPPLTVVSAATFSDGPLAPNSFSAAFGPQLASDTFVASAPTPVLGGVSVSVQDAAGVSRAANLTLASVEQVNFLVPPGTASGTATVTVKNGPFGTPVSAQITVNSLAPALFTQNTGYSSFNSSLSSVAAGYAIRVDPAGNQTTLPLSTPAPNPPAGSSPTVVPTPIDVTQPGTVYLALFGTGFDAAKASSTTAKIHGISVPVIYAGPVPSIPGLDQVNLPVPPSLAGTGAVYVSITIAGVAANGVGFAIQ